MSSAASRMSAASVPSTPTNALPQNQPTMYEPTSDDIKRRQAISRAWKAYRGEFKKPLAVKDNAPDDNVLTNRCVGIVDTGVDWLSSKPFTLDVLQRGVSRANTRKSKKPGKKPPQFAAYQDYLDDLFGDVDDMMTLFAENCQNAAIAGHTFTQIVWDAAKMDMPRLVLLDPSNIYVTCDPDDANTPICYTIETIATLGLVTQYSTPATISKRRVILRQDPDGNAKYTGGMDKDDTWTITDYSRKGSSGAWSQVGTPRVWPYPFPPLVDAPNLVNPNEYWGLPDLSESIIALNQALIFNRSNTMRINKNHAMPWGLIAGAGGDMKRLPIEPGMLLSVPQGATLLMPAIYGDIAGSKVYADDLMGDMDEQSRVAAIAYGRHENLPRGNIPGVTAELYFLPTTSKTAMKRRLLGRMWRNLCLWCLALKFGVGVLETVRVEIHWPSMLPTDDLAGAQSAQLIDSLDIVSKHTLAANLNYDYDKERELMDEEAEEAQERAQKFGLPTAGADDLGEQVVANDDASEGGNTNNTPPTNGQQPPAQQQQMPGKQQTMPPKMNMPPAQPTPGQPKARGRTR